MSLLLITVDLHNAQTIVQQQILQKVNPQEKDNILILALVDHEVLQKTFLKHTPKL